MDTQTVDTITLEAIPANRRLVEELASRNLISTTAREHALELLYPAKNWGLWASRLLLALGLTLVLSGIVYFFAFNWVAIPVAAKLASVQFAIMGCLGAAYYYGLGRLRGKALLLSASVLVGVFLAVFGQIYQTGADAYSLFMMWALLILPWVIISEFLPLWGVWLVISNLFLGLCWEQASLPSRESEDLIAICLIVFNGVFLGLREYFYLQSIAWLKGEWARIILVISILLTALVPTLELTFIMRYSTPSYSLLLAAVASLITHAGFYYLYRFKLPDMWALASTALSICLILECAAFRLLNEIFEHEARGLQFLLMGGFTLWLFTTAIVKLRSIATQMEKSHG